MPRYTQAAILRELGQPLALVDLEIPELKPGQVLVDIANSGVCHTQLLEASGRRGPDRFLPHALGHEASGTVVEISEGVSKVKPGDRVVMSWIKGTGADVPSTIYQSSDGPTNSGALCTFMRQTVTCENRVTPISEEMPLREATLLGCAILTGVGTVLNTAQVSPGSSIAIIGVGGIGLSAILGATLADAKEIIAVDLFDHKLAQAEEVGATHLINAGTRDTLAAILEITKGQGVDYAIEAAGRKETMETAFKSVRDNGGVCVLAGNLPSEERIELDPMDLIKGKRVVGTWGGDTQPDRDIPKYEKLFLSGKLPLDRLITDTYGLLAINEALDSLHAGKVGRALIDMSQADGANQ